MFPLAPEGRKQYQFEKVLVNIAALGKVLFFFLARLALLPGICFLKLLILTKIKCALQGQTVNIPCSLVRVGELCSVD